MANKKKFDNKEDDNEEDDKPTERESPKPRRPASRPGFRRYGRRRQRQSVPAYVDWKDVEFLERFVPERGKIMPRRISAELPLPQKSPPRLAGAGFFASALEPQASSVVTPYPD